MFRNRRKVGFPRKVVAYYLLFCLVSICWLAGGVLVTSHTVLSSRTTNASLSRLGKTSAALEIAYLRGGKQALLKVLQRAKSEGAMAYTAIVSPDGKYLAHTNRELQGTPAVKPTGSLLKWGSVTGIRHLDEHGQILREYQVPLVTNGQPLGSLLIAVVEPGLWETLMETAHVGSLAVLIPLLLVGVGAVVLSRLTRSVADVNSQLEQIGLQAPGMEITPQAVTARDATALGWNRVVDLIQHLHQESGSEDLNARLAEAIASRKQNEHAEILQNLSDGIAVTDMEGRITFANRAIATLLGSDATEEILQGANISEYLLDEVPSEEVQSLFDPHAKNRSAVTEIHPSGVSSNRVLRIARQPLQGQRLKGHVWSLRDVTQQRLAESMRDQFIDTATHELRTPLSNIKAYAETLATCQQIEIEKQKEFCNIINSEVTRLARFVDDLLSLSSMEVGSLSVERQKVETARLFEEVVEKVQPLLQHKDIDFEVRLPAKMGTLQLDKDKMVAVLVNLLGNAAKYTPNGGHVSLKVSQDDTQLQIAVEDTGVGISAEELPHVFDKFFRSDDPRVQLEAGTGLGLSLAREVVQMHNGEITVKSTPDQGSTFLVTIPVEK
ncbi:MAG: cell wall metabolism sensor histidine kinase WalK [Pirellulales bacterium]|nr:cell wall metabolism sensor histidine kinase WalK [Pirellulales bacterium]